MIEDQCETCWPWPESRSTHSHREVVQPESKCVEVVQPDHLRDLTKKVPPCTFNEGGAGWMCDLGLGHLCLEDA